MCPEAKAKKREKDRLYQQRKREQARLECHEDPLAQLADVATQREYLADENHVVIDTAIIESLEEEAEGIEVSGMVEEDGEVLESLDVGTWEEGFNDDFGGGFADGFGWDMNGVWSGYGGVELSLLDFFGFFFHFLHFPHRSHFRIPLSPL